MSDLVLQSPIVHALGLTLLHFVWQGAAIAIVAGLALGASRRHGASTRYLVACAALVVMMAAPIATFGMVQVGSAPAPAGPAASDVGAAVDLARGVDMTQSASVSAPANTRWLPVGVIVWFAGVTMLSVRLWWRWRLASRLRHEGVRPLPAGWRRRLHDLARRMNVTGVFSAFESPGIDVPTVVGWLRPVVLVPASALSGLPPAQLEAVLAHELAHIRRHDYAVNLVQAFAETVLFYHPAVWWVSHRIRVERELCCDDMAAGVCGDRIVYADALASLEELRTGGVALALSAGGASLMSRVRRLLEPPHPRPVYAPWTLGLAVVAVIVFAAGAQRAIAHPQSSAGQVEQRRAAEAEQAKREADVAKQREALRLAEESKARAERALVSERLAPARGDQRRADLENALRALELRARERARAESQDERRAADERVQAANELLLQLSAAFDKTAEGSIEAAKAAQASREELERAAQRLEAQTRQEPELTELRRRIAELESMLSELRRQLERQQARAPAAGEQNPIRIGNGVAAPAIIKRVQPIYPPAARAAGVSGTVALELEVDREGFVSEARVLGGPGVFHMAALDAVLQWRYAPTLLNGTAVPVILTATITFQLSEQ